MPSRGASAALLFALSLTALFLLGADLAAAGTQSVTVTPADGLHDGQIVRVQAAGYTPGSSLAVVECSAVAAATSADCDIADAHFVSASAEGTIDVSIPVIVGPFGLHRLECDAPPGCIISVADVSFAPTQLATTPIRFAAGVHPPAAPAPKRFDTSVLLFLLPTVLGAVSTAAIIRWVGWRNGLPVAAGGLLVIGAATAQVYALVLASTAASGVNAASQYAAWDVATDGVGIALVAAGVALLRDTASRPRRLAVGLLALLAVPAGLVLIIPALSSLGSGPQHEGGGTIWYGAAACVTAAIGASVATLAALRRR